MIPAGHDWLDVATMIAGLLLALGGISSLIGAFIVLSKARGERSKLGADTRLVEADTAQIYQKIADRAAERALKLDERVQQLETQVDAQQKTIEILQCENVSLRADHEKLAEEFERVLRGAHVLHDQVIELNGEPKYKPPNRRKK